MRDIIEDLLRQTEIDYNELGLYTHEEYSSRIITLREVLSLCK